MRHQKAAAGFVSFTEVTRSDEHHAYNEWHLFDHLPEQLPLPGIVWGQRWVLPPELRAHGSAAPPLDRVHYVTLYLLSEPVDETLADFRALGRRLREADRFHLHRTSHLSGPLRVESCAAAHRVLVSGEAIPYRPSTGVHVRVERGTGGASAVRGDDASAALLDVPGVAGVWTFAGDPAVSPPALVSLRATWCWLDGDPAEVAAAIERTSVVGAARAESIFSRVLVTVDPFDPWDWFDPAS